MAAKVMFLFVAVIMAVFLNNAIDGKFILVNVDGGLESKGAGVDGKYIFIDSRFLWMEIKTYSHCSYFVYTYI